MENILIQPQLNFIFGITSFTWHELPSYKLYRNKLENLLEQNLNLSKYGTGVKHIVVGFIAYPIHLFSLAEAKEEREFVDEMKLISISIIVNYEKLMVENDEQAFERIKKTYYKSIKEILPTLNIPDFNIDEFIIDLEKVLF